MLIDRFQKGERQAFDALIQKHQARAYQYAYRLAKDSEQAADVVAEAFVRVFRALGTFKGESAFTTWLYRILTNCYLDMRKKEMNRPSTSLDIHLQTDEGDIERQFEDSARSPHEESERNERERTVIAAVEQLPPYQKAMIMMYHVEMLSYEEIAQTLSLPIGTVKSRLNRARLSLRSLLREDQDLFIAA